MSPGLQSLGRWTEGVCPFAALLLCVFIYEHSIGLVIFLWLSVFLSQVATARSRPPLHDVPAYLQAARRAQASG